MWKYLDNLCICEKNEETQLHIFWCKDLKFGNEDQVDYSNLFFGSVNEIAEITYMFEMKLKLRKLRMENEENDEIQRN